MPGAYEATYWPQGGDPIKTIVLVDRNVESFPGGFEANIAEKRTEVAVRYDQIKTVQRGDKITLPDETFIVKDEVDNDHFAITVTVK